MEDLFAEQLKALRTRSLDRYLRKITSANRPAVEIGGCRLINFSSDDYLGLTNDPRLREAATRATIPALASKNDVILLDKLCHASLIDGARLSGSVPRIFPHNHLDKLKSHLKWARREHPGNRARSFIYSTAPPPAIVAAALAAVDFLAPEGEERRLLLRERIRLMQERLPSAGLRGEGAAACSANFSWIVGEEQAALNLAAALQSDGFLVPAIRYQPWPKVPRDCALL